MRLKKSKLNNVWAVIPARWNSTRFPGKILAPIAGRPMIEHVYERAKAVPSVDRVLVATDNQTIKQVVEGFGGEAIMTGEHSNGTDRIAEAVRLEIESDYSKTPTWILNVQGDEPLIHPTDLEILIQGIQEKNADIGTLIYPLSFAEYLDPNVVKAVIDKEGRALYFSRGQIPYNYLDCNGWHHYGIYIFRTSVLFEYQKLSETPLSKLEQLEQLRALENGYTIHCFVAENFTVGVDVFEDIAKVEEIMNV